MEKEIGRNQPCWCGSGRKYKTCHADFVIKKELRNFSHESSFVCRVLLSDGIVSVPTGPYLYFPPAGNDISGHFWLSPYPGTTL